MLHFFLESPKYYTSHTKNHIWGWFLGLAVWALLMCLSVTPTVFR